MWRRLRHCAIPGYSPICMDSNDPQTVEYAFMKRLLRDIPVPNSTVLDEFAEFVSGFLSSHVPRVAPLSFQEWLDSTGFNEARKDQLRQAHHDLRGGRPTRRQCSHIDTFVKSEAYVEWKQARMINSRCDAFKVFSGPMIKAIERVVYALPWFIKHIPVTDRPAAVLAMKQANRRYFQTDFTAFESHFTSRFLDICECALYRHCLSSSPDCVYMCEALMGKNNMRTRSGISASVSGRRMSGDTCTSLGNGFTNLMLAMFIAHKQGAELDGFVEGDDGLFSTTADLNAAAYDELGFTIKVDEVDDPCEASFCGLIFSNSAQIIRDPRKFFMTFGWTQSFINAGDRIMDELQHAKAMSALCETPDCPIVSELAYYAYGRTRHTEPRFVTDGYHRAPASTLFRQPEPSADTRLLFERKFGVSVPTQLSVEACIREGEFHLIPAFVPPTMAQSEYTRDYVVVT